MHADVLIFRVQNRPIGCPPPKNHALDLALGRAHNVWRSCGITLLRLYEEGPGWTTVPAAQLVQPCAHGFYYRAVGVVIFESPDEGATKPTRHTSTHITCFQPHGDGIVVGPKGLRV